MNSPAGIHFILETSVLHDGDFSLQKKFIPRKIISPTDSVLRMNPLARRALCCHGFPDDGNLISFA